MALQTTSASRARSDAVVGALIVAAVAILIAGVYTFLSGTGSIQTSSETGIGTTVSTQEQQALADFRLSEKGIATAAERQAAEQQALADFRLSEKGATTIEEARVAELKALADFRLSEHTGR